MDDQPAYIAQFKASANEDSTAPHPRANWHVLADLGVDMDVDPWNGESFAPFSREDLAAAARKLLQRNSKQLDQAGVDLGS
jgi:hypothetical protein